MSLDSSTQVHSSWILENAKKKKKKRRQQTARRVVKNFFQVAEFRKVSEIMRETRTTMCGIVSMVHCSGFLMVVCKVHACIRILSFRDCKR